MAINTIGVLTSGGDAPGMNAAIRAVVRSAIASGMQVIGIRRGYNGLINGDTFELDARSVDGIQTRGGTMLYTARCMEFKTEAGVKKAADICRYMGIGGIVAIGGDGTFRGALDLSRSGICTVGIPATIDNDIACTRYSIGFDTACNTALESIDRLRDTMQSHERCSVVEVMGNKSGALAMYVGVASGATSILIPEKPVDLEKDVFERMRRGRIQHRNHHIVIVAEGVGHADDIAKAIHEATGVDTRVTVLGHVQRGGSPTARDRVAATRMGCRAVECLAAGMTNRVVCAHNDEIIDRDIDEALAMKPEFHEELYRVSQMTVL